MTVPCSGWERVFPLRFGRQPIIYCIWLYLNLSIFRIFIPDPNFSQTERKHFFARARNTLKTVAKIGDHPNILKVWDRTGDDGIPIEGSDWSEAGTLSDLIADNPKGLDVEKAMNIFDGILNGLEIIHNNDIIHRALNPDNILMTGDTPKLMNFDLAYHLETDEEHITVLPDSYKIKEDPYIAPEIFDKRDCIPASDLFSAGVILYQMLTGTRPFKRSTDLIKSNGRITKEAIYRLFQRKHNLRLISTYHKCKWYTHYVLLHQLLLQQVFLAQFRPG